jgi:hypothetical protein
LLVREPDPVANSYRTRWRIVSASGARILDAGDGGEARFIRGADGTISGDLGGSAARWSAGDDWIAYTRLSDGASSLWVSNTANGRQLRVSPRGVEVRDFYWLGGGRLVFEVAAIERRSTPTTSTVRGRGISRMTTARSRMRCFRDGRPSFGTGDFRCSP